ncbi:AraC family transcriptional regulator [Xanthobacter sp.]|uniref:AraC family transcriptional regulator n=1 Tax=Xanthobacter sp. TaxID=35809 RepID=UPI0025E655FC|nr:AraC family transcriptional regulator [Xanthobacter sp.]
MFNVGPNEKVFPVVKISKIVDALKDEGVSLQAALAGISISESELNSPLTKISINQIIQSYRNALKCSQNPSFAFDVGSKFHVSTYGIYGLALLSGVSFRQTVAFAVQYHQLTAPLVAVAFEEQPPEAGWLMTVFPFKQIDAELNGFIVDLQMGAHLCLHRDLMGADFHPTQVKLTSARRSWSARHAEQFGYEVLYEQPQNKLVFASDWLDKESSLGNSVIYAQITEICDQLLTELKQNTGVAGRVRRVLLASLDAPPSLDALAGQLGLSTRTLRRRLQQENTSYRELVDDLRAQIAIRYVRDTRLTVEGIALLLGFSDAATFRNAFRRWTNTAPNEFRRTARA